MRCLSGPEQAEEGRAGLGSRGLGRSAETPVQPKEHCQGCRGASCVSQEGVCLGFPNTLRYGSGAARGEAQQWISGDKRLGPWLQNPLPSEVCEAPSPGGRRCGAGWGQLWGTEALGPQCLLNIQELPLST